jgi:hypothetical protein
MLPALKLGTGRRKLSCKRSQTIVVKPELTYQGAYSTFLFQTMTVAQLVKKFSVFYRN